MIVCRARLELELSQQSALVARLPVTLQELLRQALASHRYALRLNEENPDALFNTAQVIVSLAETISESSSSRTQWRDEAVALLQEALELLNACFSRQEMLLEEQTTSFSNDTDGGVPLEQETIPHDTMASEDEVMEESATIQSPTTISDLLDTARASLTALTTLIPLSDGSSVDILAQMADAILRIKIPHYLAQMSGEERAALTSELTLENATLVAALACAKLNGGAMDEDDFLQRVAVFETLDLQTNVGAILSYADVLHEFASIKISQSSSASSSNTASLAQTLWTQLTKAQELYGRAVKLDVPESRERKAAILESRGDVEMYRFRLATSLNLADKTPGISPAIKASAPVLVKNAQTYYRGSTTLHRAAGDDVAAAKVHVREIVAGMIRLERADLPDDEAMQVRHEMYIVLENKDNSRDVLSDMFAEGLLGKELEGLLQAH